MVVCFDKIFCIYKYFFKELIWIESDFFVNEKISGVYFGVDGCYFVIILMGLNGQMFLVWDVFLLKVV